MNSLKENPFKEDMTSSFVYVSSGKGPYENTKTALSKINIKKAAGKRVLLKPNAGRVSPEGSGTNTNPHVVAAAIDAFREAGAEVAIGESPIFGVKTMEAFEVSGIAAIANERNCPLIDMDKRPSVTMNIEEGIAIQTIKVCSEVLEYDIIVSIPVMKTHMHTGVTLSVKNMKGCLWRKTKTDLHMLPKVENNDDLSLNIAIADMSSVLVPHLTIIDGTVGMEGLGPSAGNPKKLDMVLTGIDPFEADAVACRLMGLNAEKIPHLRIAAERGYGIIDVSQIQVKPDSWENLISPFETPPENLSIHFPGVTILDEQSCSACQSTVLMFLKRYGEKIFDYFPDKKNVVLAIGKGHESVPEETICIGNCTSNHKDKCIFVSGCPPVASQILKAITGEESGDS
ncbi:DUF362 domain-containing protein [Spirochaetota bacterium]